VSCSLSVPKRNWRDGSEIISLQSQKNVFLRLFCVEGKQSISEVKEEKQVKSKQNKAKNQEIL
jgi:hypothetical protein